MSFNLGSSNEVDTVVLKYFFPTYVQDCYDKVVMMGNGFSYATQVIELSSYGNSKGCIYSVLGGLIPFQTGASICNHKNCSSYHRRYWYTDTIQYKPKWLTCLSISHMWMVSMPGCLATSRRTPPSPSPIIRENNGICVIIPDKKIHIFPSVEWHHLRLIHAHMLSTWTLIYLGTLIVHFLTLHLLECKNVDQATERQLQ